MCLLEALIMLGFRAATLARPRKGLGVGPRGCGKLVGWSSCRELADTKGRLGQAGSWALCCARVHNGDK